ncbi:hypothetical protein BE04_03865 [Sorangium cellulosum]|uniref:Tail sheath protein C-terminal domain-containing protein n=3 Tax=Sorangium cellulosum TaxID=56 RepID=A0A150Q388_SORCE|nr:hypothetical protein SCE1572_47180 [Sorangium cellulosum So0157-2]KYF62432.1 hypothetical protein BE04_03865 [Sorangium cellulosum]
MVLPGTYIEVRSEGLIGIGGISTGNIGIVGTAAKGPINKPITLGSYADALDVFGLYDSVVKPVGDTNDPLTLTRAIEQAFKGGASTVIAVRIANGAPVAASRAIDSGSGAAFTLTAPEAGTWGNQIKISIVNGAVTGEYKLTLTYRNVVETYVGTPAKIHADIRAEREREGRLVDASAATVNATTLALIDPPQPLGVAAAGGALGSDLPNVTSTDYADGLATLVDQRVNIVLVAAKAGINLKGVVGDHLETTEQQGRERIALLGVSDPGSATSVSAIVTEAGTVNNDRIVLVTPGVVYTDPGTRKPQGLPPSYLAAAVAGKLASLAPHVSLTNKALDIDGVTVTYGAPITKTLLDARTLVVRPKIGFQVVKGITTDNGAFKQISIRRTIDYAKAGVRLGCDPYIGRLNNGRVRAALKATLDGFLSQMVLDEMLVEYELTVNATRQQEINGICAVAMTLKPTFSIDFIRVTMTLQ